MPERQSALLAPRHQSSRDRDFLPVHGLKSIDQRLRVMRALALRWIRLQPLLAHGASFVNADVSDFVEWSRHSVLFLPERANLAKPPSEGKRQSRIFKVY